MIMRYINSHLHLQCTPTVDGYIWCLYAFYGATRRDSSSLGLNSSLQTRLHMTFTSENYWGVNLLTYLSAVCAVVRCLSVRLSVTFVYCIQMSEDIGKLLSMPGSPIILVFLTHAPIPNSKSFRGAQNACGAWKIFAIFDWNRSLSI